MKFLHLLSILLVAVLLASCAAKFSADGIAEKAFVESFLKAQQDSYNDETELLAFVSPTQLQKLGATGDGVLCNAYSFARWEITGYNHKTGDVDVMIFGAGDIWQHQLTFRLTKEDDRLYLVPMQFDYDYIDPWFALEENVGAEQKGFVGEFLQHMIDDYNDEPLLLGYISPAYCSENGVDKDRYKCNAYSPVDYSIGAWDPATGVVEAIIVGEDEGWIHKLFFKISEENGRFYLWPGSHSATYIDPWFDVETNI